MFAIKSTCHQPIPIQILFLFNKQRNHKHFTCSIIQKIANPKWLHIRHWMLCENNKCAKPPLTVVFSRPLIGTAKCALMDSAAFTHNKNTLTTHSRCDATRAITHTRKGRALYSIALCLDDSVARAAASLHKTTICHSVPGTGRRRGHIRSAYTQDPSTLCVCPYPHASCANLDGGIWRQRQRQKGYSPVNGPRRKAYICMTRTGECSWIIYILGVENIYLIRVSCCCGHIRMVVGIFGFVYFFGRLL